MMRIFLLGINCILIISLALLLIMPCTSRLVFVLLFIAIGWRAHTHTHGQSVGAPATRDSATIPITIVSRCIRMRVLIGIGICRASRINLFTMYDVLQSICLSVTLRVTACIVASKLCGAQWIDRIGYFIDDSLKLDRVANRWWFR